MLFLSVARQLGSGNSFARLLCCPLSSEAGRKRRSWSVKLTMPFDRIISAKEPKKLPVVLSGEEIVRFLQAVSGLRNRAALTTAYGAGLRVCEMAALKVTRRRVCSRLRKALPQDKDRSERDSEGESKELTKIINGEIKPSRGARCQIKCPDRVTRVGS